MSDPITEQIHQMGRQARAAAHQLSQLSSETKNAILNAMAQGLRDASAEILAANAKDIAAGQEKGLSSAMLDRLRLDETRLEAIAAALEHVATLPDPVGQILDD
jgi:glutamate-5-semialdehyde dehydrogenase